MMMAMYDDEHFKAYYESDWWKEIRLRALDYYDHRCAVCGDDWRGKTWLDIHHLSYFKNGDHIFYHESMDDLRPLCRIHHKKGRYQLPSIMGARKWYRRKKLVSWVVSGLWRLLFHRS